LLDEKMTEVTAKVKGKVPVSGIDKKRLLWFDPIRRILLSRWIPGSAEREPERKGICP